MGSDTTKITLLRDVSVPQEGGNEAKLVEAGKTLTLPNDSAERLIRIGAAEKAK